MIRKSILFAVVALALYAAYITYGHADPVAQHQWQLNIIKTQGYIYNDSLKKCDIVLGTSLTDKISSDSLPKGVYMLTFPGLTVWDGFLVVTKANAHPKYLFVEENAIIKAPSAQFDDYIFNHLNFYSKKTLPVLRDSYQPVGQVAGFFERHGAPRIAFTSKYLFNPVLRLFQGDTIKKLNEDAHYEEAKKMRNMVDTAEVRQVFTKLKKQVDWFQSHGTKVYFFSTPIDKEVYFNDQSKAVRAAFAHYLPASQYHYLPDVDIKDYQTIRDQIHLNTESALKYSSFIAKQMQAARENKL